MDTRLMDRNATAHVEGTRVHIVGNISSREDGFWRKTASPTITKYFADGGQMQWKRGDKTVAPDLNALAELARPRFEQWQVA